VPGFEALSLILIRLGDANLRVLLGLTELSSCMQSHLMLGVSARQF
jgi:hypothetical protein